MNINKLFMKNSPSVRLFFTTYICLLIGLAPVVVKSIKPRSKEAALIKPDIWLKGYITAESRSLEQFAADSEFRTRSQVKNEFVSKNGTDFVVSDNVDSFYYTCEADYPIKWTFPNPEQFSFADVQNYASVDSGEYRVSHLYSDADEPMNIHYRIIIKIRCTILNFLSVNLTCQSVESNLDLRSSVYIFLKGKLVLENQENTVQVLAQRTSGFLESNETPTSVILPCRPAAPNIKITLQKETTLPTTNPGNSTQTQKIWSPLTPFQQKYLSFDPKVGFTLKRNVFSTEDDIFGLYKCSVTIQNDDGTQYPAGNDQFVNVAVLEKSSVATKKPTPTLSFQSISILHGKAVARLQKTSISYPPETRFVCCSGDKSDPPKIYFADCTNSVQCLLLKHFFLTSVANGNIEIVETSNRPKTWFSKYSKYPNKCISRVLTCNSVVLACQSDNVDFMDHFINVFHPLAEGPVTNRSARVSNASLSSTDKEMLALTGYQAYVSLTRYETAAIMEDEDKASQTIMIMIGHAYNSFKEEENILKLNGEENELDSSEVLICDEDIEDVYYLRNIIAQNDVDVKDESDYIRDIKEYSRDFYYEGEPIIFMCLGLKITYERGAYLRLNWRNGSKILISDPVSKGNHKFVAQTMSAVALYPSGNAEMFNRVVNTHTVYGREMVAEINMSSVDCWMPKQNSKKWKKISKEIRVLPTAAPAYFEKENETKYFSLGEVGYVITCSLEQGTPSPEMTVTRDGKTLKIDFYQKRINQTKIVVPKVGATLQIGILDESDKITGLKIAFSAIEHSDHNSTFQCISANVNRTIIRTIRIVVVERPRLGVYVALGCLTILFLVLGLLGVSIYHNKRRVRSLQSSNN